MNKRKTPMMEQWSACKKMAKDALLFFRLGDFYEAFYKDAILIAKELDLTLTKRQDIPMCGVPHHTCDNYVDKLVAKGYKIAIAEQVEDPSEKRGLVKRKIVRVLSPGTVVSSSLISEKSNNYFISLSQTGKLFAIAAIDLTTSEFKVMEFESQESLKDELCKLKPAELLASSGFKKRNAKFIEELSYNFKFVINEKEDWYFDYQYSYEALLRHFKVETLDGFGLSGHLPSIGAAGSLLGYLKDELFIDIGHIDSITRDYSSEYMSIDSSCMRNLEITESSHKGGIKNTLLEVIDRTNTSMGGRLLKSWIKHPLTNIKEIERRQESIEELLHLNLEAPLKNIRDIERITMRIQTNISSPRDLLALKSSLVNIGTLKKSLVNLKRDLINNACSNLEDLKELQDLITVSIDENPPFRASDGGIIKDGFNSDLDKLRKIRKNSKEWIASYQNKLRKELDIKTLRVGYNKIFGCYIEVSKAQAKKIAKNFIRKQTLVNGERFISEELKNFEIEILTAEERIKQLENSLYLEIKREAIKYQKSLLKTAKNVAIIDVLNSLSKIAKINNYKKPKVDTSDIIDIKDGRHPIIEANLPLNSFTPNDAVLNDENRLILITGPNMAGKSTYIRQTALIVVLAQIGSFVPASSAHIGIVDKLFSRIGANDNLTKGQSTFMVEMTESANILNNATSKSLVILDEIGRGTSTYDGISIAWAIAEFLLTEKEKRAKTLFATHFLELTELEKKIKGAKNYNVTIEKSGNEIIFLRKIKRGSSSRSFGIEVAKLAGIPQKTIKRADEILKKLEKPKKEKRDSYPVFEYLSNHPIIDEIDDIDIDNLTPIDALLKLRNIKSRQRELREKKFSK